MTFKDIKGRKKVIKTAWKYKANWDKPCRSKIQKRVKDLLRPHWEVEMVYEEFPVAGTKLTLDFYNASRKIAVEVQGNQHNTFSKHFHNNSRQNFLRQIKRDINKHDYCEINNIRLVEIFEDDLLGEDLLIKLDLV